MFEPRTAMWSTPGQMAAATTAKTVRPPRAAPHPRRPSGGVQHHRLAADNLQGPAGGQVHPGANDFPIWCLPQNPDLRIVSPTRTRQSLPRLTPDRQTHTAPHLSAAAGRFCVLPHRPAVLRAGSSCHGRRDFRISMLRASLHVRHAVLAENVIRDFSATLTPVLGRSGFHAVCGHIFMVLCGTHRGKEPGRARPSVPASWLQVHGGRWSQPRGFGTVLGVPSGNVSQVQCHIPRSRYGRELCFSLELP